MLTEMRKAILKIADELNRYKTFNWRIGGTSCLFIQGVDIEPSDIELITSKKGAFKINQIFQDFEEKPVRLEKDKYFSCFLGIFKIDGIKVEVQGELIFTNRGQKIDLLEPITSIQVDNIMVPVCSLELMRERYQKYGGNRAKLKVQKINELLQCKKSL